MPVIPILSKAVQFSPQLEHVCHFLQDDRPVTINADFSKIENYDSCKEYPVRTEDWPANPRTSPLKWELLTPNFPHNTFARKSLPVRLENVWLSADQKSLLGSVSVINLAFQKCVICRYTLDYWKTTSEVMAEYSHEMRPRETPFDHDCFIFSIKLSDIANLESNPLFFCVCYSVNGDEFWDNNATTNFQVDFVRKPSAPNDKNGF